MCYFTRCVDMCFFCFKQKRDSLSFIVEGNLPQHYLYHWDLLGLCTIFHQIRCLCIKIGIFIMLYLYLGTLKHEVGFTAYVWLKSKM